MPWLSARQVTDTGGREERGGEHLNARRWGVGLEDNLESKATGVDGKGKVIPLGHSCYLGHVTRKQQREIRKTSSCVFPSPHISIWNFVLYILHLNYTTWQRITFNNSLLRQIMANTVKGRTLQQVIYM